MDARTPVTPDRAARFEASLSALAPAGRIGLAVSGGPDSIALLIMAHAARPGTIAAATVDHGLRPEAADEARFVAETCARLTVPHSILAVAVGDQGTGIQAAARAARYQALAQWAVREKIHAIATAHHADDQAETVLMRLARGAGLGGLAGIRRSRSMPEAPGVILIRPLLDWRKAELEAVVEAAGVDPVRDPSNSDRRYDRTHARALLEGGWPEPGRVAAAANHLAEAEEALAWAAGRCAETRIGIAGTTATIDARQLPRELRRRLLLITLARLNPDRVPRGDSLDGLMAALDRGRISTLCGYRFEPGPPWRVAPASPRRAANSSGDPND